MTARLGQSMAAQRDFVANAAHQLRTPLTGLRLRLEAAGLKTEDDALQRDLAAGEREADRLAKTVTDLLTLAREGQRPAAVAPLDLGAAGEAAFERWIWSPRSTAPTSTSATAAAGRASTPRPRTSR